MEDLAAQVDAYCERLSPAFWAEPANAISNIAFLVAAFIGWRAAGARGRRGDWAVIALVGVLTAIGIGSFLFHTFATRWAGIADVAPIMLFIVLYIHLAMRRYLRLPPWAALLIAIGFIVAAPQMSAWLLPVTGPLNGTLSYVPTFLLMTMVAVVLALTANPAWPGVAAAAALLLVSLVMRTLDAQDGDVCAAFPLGTHWAWHLLNGTLLGLLVVTFVRHGAPEGDHRRS